MLTESEVEYLENHWKSAIYIQLKPDKFFEFTLFASL